MRSLAQVVVVSSILLALCACGDSTDTSSPPDTSVGGTAAGGTGPVGGAGGNWSEPEIIAGAIQGPNVVTTDDVAVFWASDDGTVRSLPHAGGAPLTLASGQSTFYDIEVDDDAVYWTDDRVMKVDKTGSGAPVQLADGQQYALRLVLDATHAYWTTSNDTVARVPKSGGVAEVLATDLNEPDGIAVDSSSIFVAQYAVGAIGKMPLGGGTVEPLALGITSPDDVMTDGTDVFWTAGGSLAGDGKIMRIANDGGDAVDLASGLRDPWFMALHEGYVYFTDSDGGLVARVPKGGGGLDVIASGQSVPHGIAVGGGYVYWCNNDDGTLRRATHPSL